MPIILFFVHAVALQISWVFLDSFATSFSIAEKYVNVVALALPIVGLVSAFIWFWQRRAGMNGRVARTSSIVALAVWFIALAV